MIEAHARLDEVVPGTEGAYPSEPPARPEGDFARYEGERRCVLEHFSADDPRRSVFEVKLAMLWDVRADWAAEQLQQLDREPARMKRHEEVAQRQFEQVCPAGRASAPFLAQLKD